MKPLRIGIAALLPFAIAAIGCAGNEAPAAQPSPVVGDTAIPLAGPAVAPKLSPLADSIAQRLVLLPRNQTWFTAAARGKRMLLDLGRVDLEVRKDSARATAYRQVVAGRASLPIGTRLRLHGPWGSDDAEVGGYDSWNGRIVAVLTVPPRVDSLARRVEPLPASAVRVTGITEPRDPPCLRDTITLDHARRLDALRDSVEEGLRASAEEIPYERLAASVSVRTTVAHGCFPGGGRTILVSSLRAGSFEFVRERAFLIFENGRVAPLRITGSPWRAHDAIYALDADGDGSDDLAVRGAADRSGGTVIFKLAASNRLEKLTGGFNWETR